MRMTLEIDMDNAAFEDYPASEAARILRDAARRIEDGGEVNRNLILRDVNGNAVGHCAISEG